MNLIQLPIPPVVKEQKHVKYDANRIRKPPYFKLSPIKRGRGARPHYVIGFDSEAENGKPFLYQFAHPDGHVDLIDVPWRRYASLVEFFAYLRDHCTRKDVEYICVGFNLQYEWTQLFASLPDDAKSAQEFVIDLVLADRETNVRIRAMNEKRYALTAEFGGTKRRVRVIDGAAFFSGLSLDKASAIIGAGRKLDKPETFTRATFARDPDAIEYAKQDAVLTQRLGEYIMQLHVTYDVATCVSAPHFAARVFRHHFLKTEIPLPEPQLEQFGLWSYHGGKNGYYEDGPREIEWCWHYDIRSAYPEAMRQLPNIETGVWEWSDHYIPNAHAVWHIRKVQTDCRFRAFVDEGEYVTSYELDAALDLNEIELLSCEGYVFTGTPGGPLVEYVDRFFTMKNTTNNDAERNAAKLFLNSLYGKFFQKVPLGNVGMWDIETGEYVETDPSQEFDYEAGGLYHPPLASLITGYVRAKIHRLEHRYNAVMTSTDGFFAYQAPDTADLGKGLGHLTAEDGRLLIWRERLYCFYPSKIEHKPSCEPDCEDQHPVYALHGFHAKLPQLLQIPLARGKYRYEATNVITLRMSTRAFRKNRYGPGTFVTLPYDLELA